MTATHSEAPTLSHDGLAAELLKRRRKRLPALTAALVIAAMVALGALGGVEAQQHWGAKTSRSSRARAFPTGFPTGGALTFGGGSGQGGFGAGATAGGGTNGTVTLIKGPTLYVTDASGNTVMVHTSARVQVTKTISGTVKTVHPGDSVTVVGTQNKDGSYNARQLTIGAASNG
ncbi:MAG TPA: hypothetical protein VGT98_14375 [Candidatus Elarobacter sp.]|nr:hypothetical protein [Candidatus Elarobacter sp.]